jgi:hypothetical protein
MPTLSRREANRMNDAADTSPFLQREILVNALYEAAELEHNLMCTYLYAAASLKEGEVEGLTASEAEAVQRWRRVLTDVAIQEMGHLVAVWNITSALGASPRIGRTNFPLDPGYLPAGITVKLAPFGPDTLQHFVFLERPHGSTEVEGPGFACERPYARGTARPHLTPMGRDYDTVGAFYERIGEGLRTFVERYGETVAFGGDPALQLSPEEVNLPGARHVRCLKTALAAFTAIVEQGEGAPRDSVDSHFQKFLGIRAELASLEQKNPSFAPAFPAATNPVLRRPPRPEGRVWIEDADAFATLDLANTSYALMLRLTGYAYALRGPGKEKSLAVDLAIGLMQAMMPLAQRAARLPAGPSNPHCNAGMSFITLRDPSPLPPGPAARRLLLERFAQLADAGAALRTSGDARAVAAAEQLSRLATRAAREFDLSARARLRGAALHPLTLLRHLDTQRISRQCEGPLDPSRCHAGRARGRGSARMSVGRHSLSPARWRSARDRTAGQPRHGARGGAICFPGGASDRRGTGRISRHPMPLWRLEEQALLRWLASRDRLHGERRARDGQDRNARGA